MERNNFFILREDEVLEFAKGILGREMSESEYCDVKKMFEFGIESCWSEILQIAIDDRCVPDK
jgi:hypothetical protein